MKKIKFILFFVFILFITPNILASSAEVNVTFNLLETSYTTVTKQLDGDITIFTLTNNIPSMDLTTTQLKEILSQKSGNGASPLTIYGTLNILVTPIEETSFNPLVGKDTYYRGSSAGSWVSSTTAVINQESTAEVKPMNSNFWPYGFAVSYRTSVNDAWKSTVAGGIDLTNKTMEEKLATLLNIDLEASPNGVVNEYGNLFYFRILPSGYNYKTRFDFYSEKEGVTPQLKADSSTEYLISSLNLLGTRYVYISYAKTEAAGALAIIDKEEEKINIWALSGFLIFTCGTLIVFKKYGKKH
ncbi:MAG TPA: hypothetical protein PLT65_04805 [Bacilli bacterium]|nr:hypothetical protein [Bacilli bacterium]